MFFFNIKPSSFLIKNDGRQITKTAKKNNTTNAMLILILVKKNERLVIQIVNNKINNVALRWEKPKRNRWWWMWFLSAKKGLLPLEILIVKTLRVSTKGYENKHMSIKMVWSPNK